MSPAPEIFRLRFPDPSTADRIRSGPLAFLHVVHEQVRDPHSNCICDGANTDERGEELWCVGCNFSQHDVCMGLFEATLPDMYYCHECQPTMPIHQETVATPAGGTSGPTLSARRRAALDLRQIVLSPDMVTEWHGRSPGLSREEAVERVAEGMAVIFEHVELPELVMLYRRLLLACYDNVVMADRVVELATLVLEREGVTEVESGCLRNAFRTVNSP